MDEMIKIPVLMRDLVTPLIDEQISYEDNNDPFCDGEKNNYFGPSLRWLLATVLHSLNLSSTDEIAILTTNIEQYIPICVSVTIFNYGTISRVVTEKTKVVIVIHDNGYSFPDIAKKVETWKERGIHVIEDCATVIGLDINNKKIGSFADYSLFSLPKIFPTSSGGLLRTTKNISLSLLSESLLYQKNKGIFAARKYLTKFKYFNKARITRVNILKEKALDFLLEPSKLSIPYRVGFLTTKKEVIERNFSLVDWGTTLHSDLLYIPINPLVEKKYFKELISVIYPSLRTRKDREPLTLRYFKMVRE